MARSLCLPNQENTTIVKMLIDNWISRFGVPMKIHSDQGKNLKPNLFQRVTKVLGMRKTRTTTLYPQSDGIVELFNRTMEEYLSKVVAVHQKDCDRHLPLFLLAYQSWYDGSDIGAHSFRKRTSSTLCHLVPLSEWRIKGGHRLRRWLEGEVAERLRIGAPQDPGGEWQNETALRP